MIEPTHADLGRMVIYRSPGGEVVETGELVAYTQQLAFVQYRGVQPFGSRFADLEWAEPDCPT